MARLASGDRQSVSRDYSHKADGGSPGLDADVLYDAILAALDNEDTRKTLLVLDDRQIENLISLLSEVKRRVVRNRIAELKEQDILASLRFGSR